MPLVTPREVSLAYRLFLGREPESADVVNSLCQNTQSIKELGDIFLKSPEFVQRMGGLLNHPNSERQRHPFHLPRIPVETEVSSEVLRQMFERIQNEWEHLGATEPYWSVVTQPQYYQAEFGEHREQFYRSGEHSCDLFLAALRRAGINPSSLQTCLELGCGVGRVTGPLAARFNKLLAVDISNGHLARAKKHLNDSRVRNVDFKRLDRVTELLELPEVDAIFSLITLQHNPPPVIAWMLKTLFSRLREGGIAYIQLPTYCNGYMFEAERYLHSTPPDTLEMHFIPQVEIFRLISISDCRCLEVREDQMVGDEVRMLSNTFLIQKNVNQIFI